MLIEGLADLKQPIHWNASLTVLLVNWELIRWKFGARTLSRLMRFRIRHLLRWNMILEITRPLLLLH